MASLKDIRTKIQSVSSTAKTTKAMKMVSVSKLKKAEQIATASKNYAEKLTHIMQEIFYKLEISGLHPTRYMQSEDRAIKVVDIVCITSDKGLCGGFSIQTFNKALALIKSYEKEGKKVRVTSIGKKGNSYFRANKIEVYKPIADLSAKPEYEKVTKLMEELSADYLEGKTDKLVLVYSGFKSRIAQDYKMIELLPATINTEDMEGKSQSLVEIEPDNDEDEILENLILKYLEYNVYYGLIDSLAAEHAARIQAMDAATDNASEMKKKLTISYNKARQEAITNEIIEINTGMEAMK